jgi:hypothetical protein
LRRRIAAANEEEKTSKIASGLHNSLMSSEESDDEGMEKRPLPWRSLELTNFFSTLDERWEKNMTPYQRRHMVHRETGRLSTRDPATVPQRLREWTMQDPVPEEVLATPLDY